MTNRLAKAAAAPRDRSRQIVEMTALDVSLVRDQADSPRPASRELQAVAAELKQDAAGLAQELAAVIRGIPEYGLVKDASVWNEIRQVVRANVPVFYGQVVDGREASDDELAAARHFARRRVHQGIPLHAHLNAYRKGMWVLWGELVARVIRRPRLQQELLLRAAWAFRHHEQICGAVAESYCAEQGGQARQREQMLRALFDAIIDGSISSDEELKARAGGVGLDLEHEFHLVLASTTAANAVLPAVPLGTAIAEAAGMSLEDVVAVERGSDLILLVPSPGGGRDAALDRAKLSRAVAAAAGALTVCVGVSGRVAGVVGVRAACREATRAIEIGRTLEPDQIVFFYDSYVVHDTLETGARAGHRLVRDTLGPLLELGTSGRRMVETLDAYFRGGTNLKVAAGLLDIHPNTLAYRIRQIHRLTGLDLDHHDHRLRTEMALRLLALQTPRPSTNGQEPNGNVGDRAPAATPKPRAPRSPASR
ncbi:MAG: hypothetical protein QOD06_2502 [Candidatus Binatota bacterium]|nr:hypothetical protein [Candidatus Binatota bacterium]